MEIGPSTDPFSLLDQWIKEARASGVSREPTAMALATVTGENAPSVRMVLCKSWSSQDGLIFYTNYDSPKAKDLASRPQASVAFFWDHLSRQVRVAGDVERTSRETSEAYWRSRPRESQLSGYVSKQSKIATSRDLMEKAWHEAEEKFRGKEIPCPANWGGFALRPKTMEFWVGLPGRFHDRHLFQKSPEGWTYSRLYP